MPIERIDFAEFEKRFVWAQGEHCIAIAPTGAGKTTLLRKLMPRRKNNLFFGTKIRDSAYTSMIRTQGFRRVESVEEIRAWDRNVLLWPRWNKDIRQTMLDQHTAFKDAINMVAEQGRWTTWLDEAKYLNQMLKLGTDMTYLAEQARSDGGTIIFGTQRPVWIASVLSSATHAFLWKTPDGNDMGKLSDLGGVDSKFVRNEIQTLDAHEFLYIRTRGAQVDYLRTQVKV